MSIDKEGNVQDIVEWMVRDIMTEARRRFKQNPECPGGFNSKIHSVLMDLMLATIKEMD